MPKTTTADQLLEFFKQVGDVKFVRMAGDETQPTRFAFVEFVQQDSVARALTLNGVMFGDRPLKYALGPISAPRFSRLISLSVFFF